MESNHAIAGRLFVRDQVAHSFGIAGAIEIIERVWELVLERCYLTRGYFAHVIGSKADILAATVRLPFPILVPWFSFLPYPNEYVTPIRKCRLENDIVSR